MFVIITSDGTEGSTPVSERKFNKWTKTLPARGVSAHAFVIKYKGGGTPEIVRQPRRGHRRRRCIEYMNTSNALADKMKVISRSTGARLSDRQP